MGEFACPNCGEPLIETLPREDHTINKDLVEIPLLCCPNNVKGTCGVVGIKMTLNKKIHEVEIL